MTFLVNCPNCGRRSAYEFNFGGEVLRRPSVDAPDEEWYNYAYGRKNVRGVQKEWIYHRFGCKSWFIAVRDTRDNRVVDIYPPRDDKEREWVS